MGQDEPRKVVVWAQNVGRRFPLLQYHDPESGKRKSQSAGTADPDEVERKRAALELALNNGTFRAGANRTSWPAFRELFEAEYVAPLRPETRKNFRTALDHFQRVCSPKPLRTITERTLSAFVAGLRASPGRAKGETMKPSSIKVVMQFIHTALTWAVEQKLMAGVPAFPAVKVPKRKPRPVPAADVRKLLDAADPEMRAFLLCAWLAGLRFSEAFALRWSEGDGRRPWVDLAADRVVLPAEFTKGVEDQWVPLDGELKAALVALPRREEDDGVFDPAVIGTTPSAAWKRVGRVARRAGVSITMRTLRRGFACEHAPHAPASVLQKLMRHASIQTTAAYYVNADEAAVRAVADRARRNAEK